MTVDEVKRYVELIINKDQTGDSITPDQFNLALKVATQDFFRQRYGLPQEYQFGSPIPRMAWEITQKITDDLRNVKVISTLTVDPTTGQATIPADYLHIASLRHTFTEEITDECGDVTEKTCTYPIKVVQEDLAAHLLCHPTKEPTKKFPIAVFQDGYIQFYPLVLDIVNLNYLKFPATPLWAFTVVNDEAVYDSANSVQIEYPDDTHIEIARLIIAYIGDNMRDVPLIQRADQVKTVGM